MNKSYYLQEITSNTPASVWQSLLDFGLSRGDSIEFAVHPDITRWPFQLLQLLPDIAELYESHRRLMIERKKTTLYLRICASKEAKEFIKSVPQLHHWIGSPEIQVFANTRTKKFYPEDPAIYCGDELVLGTISHESQVYVALTLQEREELINQGCTFINMEISNNMRLNRKDLLYFSRKTS